MFLRVFLLLATRALISPSLTVGSLYIGRATREEMSDARLPLQYRDSCAHLLIPLNRCRFEEYYLPWKCVVKWTFAGLCRCTHTLIGWVIQDERHSYEKCQYDEFKKRVAKMNEIRTAKGGARSN